ncbi:MAG TPA: molybdenum cofactor guanylyltransferase [Planctomycetota bacterium]|nr:molybdenum cofactor guanylyltransferase [Planctomycetota bacterium]
MTPFERTAPAWSLGVLAGGRSVRMGRDKASAPFRGGTLLDHVARRLAPPGVPLLVSLRPGTPDPPAPWRRVDDATPDLGPMAGIAALARAAETHFVLVVPCDLPLLPPDCGDRLLAFSKGVDAVTLRVGGRTEPFPALVARELASTLEAALREGLRRADGWHARVAAATAPFEVAFPGVDAAEALLNANDPATLADAARRLDRGAAR